MARAGAKKSGLGTQGAYTLTALLFCLRFLTLQAQDTVPNLLETGIVSPTVCGRNKLSPKIFGGKIAGPERWPWQAALLLRGRFVCGAVLIDSNWVASAAHCFQRSHKPADYQILLGYNQLSNPSSVSLQKSVHKVFVHPDFDKHHFLGSDITLMQLHIPVKFNSHILPACLPPSSVKPDPAVTCWISGWGMITEEKFLPPPMQLQEAELTLVPIDVCKDYFKPFNNAQPGSKPHRSDMEIPHVHLVLYIWENAYLDSGGPLVCPVEGIWYLIGLTSWSEECHSPVGPSVFTNVSYFAEWIKKHKQENPAPDPGQAPPAEKPPSLNPDLSRGPVLKPRMTALLTSQFLLLWLILFNAQ
uniref:Peptidase S1 domain-containing protein n=1 Tax=Sciurus vulgaris TaxID=55149 RepID=A0A8D2JNF8_SCIVU